MTAQNTKIMKIVSSKVHPLFSNTSDLFCVKRELSNCFEVCLYYCKLNILKHLYVEECETVSMYIIYERNHIIYKVTWKCASSV